MKKLYVITGVCGSGKTTALSILRGDRRFLLLKPSTTRVLETGDDEYHYNEKTWVSTEFAWQYNVDSHKYGMTVEEIDKISEDEIGLTVLHPEKLDVLRGYAGETNKSPEVVIIGLDTINEYSDQKARIDQNRNGDEGEEAFKKQKELVEEQSDIVISGKAEVVAEAIQALAEMTTRGGIVTSSVLKRLFKANTLLENIKERNIKSASYDMRLGDEYWCKGKTIKIEENGIATIPPYSYIIAQAIERARFPKNVVGRYDLPVSLFFKGITLSNSTQVDPGYRGGLMCALFNPSDREVAIKRGDHFATIEFATTTHFTDGYDGKHQEQSQISDFLKASTSTGPGGTIFEQVRSLQNFKKGFWGIILGAVILLGGAAFGFIYKLDDIRSIAEKHKLDAEDTLNNVKLEKERVTDISDKAEKAAGKISEFVSGITDTQKRIETIEERIRKLEERPRTDGGL